MEEKKERKTENHIYKRPFNRLSQVPIVNLELTDPFWRARREINKKVSLPMMLEKLKEDHHVDNFLIDAGKKEGTHLGVFYFDADLYKWVEGAFLFSRFSLPEALMGEIREIVDSIRKSQWEDGYLNTYYSINFPEKRFTNLLLFHELYCAGHLIEAGLAEKRFTGSNTLLNVSKKFIDLLVKKLLEPPIQDTDGHPEIELALIKLYRETQEECYLNLCRHLVEMRGNIPHFRTYVMRNLIDAVKTFSNASALKKQYFETHKNREAAKEEVAEFLENLTIKDWLRFVQENLNGKIYQLDSPVPNSYEPVGHAVRALYLYCGVADLFSELGDKTILHALELIWLKMVRARMYITGGVGSVSSIEGFDKDFRLKIEDSYSETCAAIANIMWNWRMFLITGKVKYNELIERLLYNAMLVGQSLDGRRYFYSNPLLSRGEHARVEWFKCPCCPTNYIRIIPQIEKYIYAHSDKGIWINQYIGSKGTVCLRDDVEVKLNLKSKFPWRGKVELEFRTSKEAYFSMLLRIPTWCEKNRIYVNGKEWKNKIISGRFLEIQKNWSNDTIKLELKMSPNLRSGDKRRKDLKNKAALSFGPLIYCLEQEDNDFDIFKARLSSNPRLRVATESNLMDNMVILKGQLQSGKIFKAIPYFAWQNRNAGNMIVWIRQ